MANLQYSRVLLGFALLLGMAAAAVAADSGALRVGAARIDITPPPEANGTPPLGKYAHEKLYVRAIVLDNGVTRATLIGADQINIQTACSSEKRPEETGEETRSCPAA